MNLKETKGHGEYMGGCGGRKGNGEIMSFYYNLNFNYFK